MSHIYFLNISYYSLFCTYSYRLWNILTVLLSVILSHTPSHSQLKPSQYTQNVHTQTHSTTHTAGCSVERTNTT